MHTELVNNNQGLSLTIQLNFEKYLTTFKLICASERAKDVNIHRLPTQLKQKCDMIISLDR